MTPPEYPAKDPPPAATINPTAAKLLPLILIHRISSTGIVMNL